MRVGLSAIVMLSVLLVALGCQSSRPELRPPKEPEQLTAPPAEQRFNLPTYPKEAFNNREPLKKLSPNQDIMTTKGTGAGMMPSYGAGGTR